YRAWGQKDPLVEYKEEAYNMFVGLMDDLQAAFAERWLKLQIEVGPPPGQGGQRPSSRGVTGPAGGLPGASRRETPMVASKAAADGLVTTGEPPPPSLQRGGDGGRIGGGGMAEPAFAPNPYAGVGRNDPCPCGSGKKFKKCHGAAA
ncbi:MAG TPA: SEC-C metal-binding domain-containing protein, partial [Gemmatimonadales bacterium]|nr:SEC-C metal-binding domain-containing protein [Gemmatimonadales bacterium]